MNALLLHKWGDSLAADCVWSQVTGMAPARAGKAILMVWQAFIDESARDDEDSDLFVMGGCISTADRWVQFARDWEKLLPRFGRLDEKGRRYFHMTEMRDMHHVVAFYRVMEKHIPAFISARYRKNDLKKAMARIHVPNAIVEWDNNDYFIGFRCLMDKFHLLRDNLTMQEILPSKEKVQFIFDDNSSKVLVRKIWDEYMGNRPPEIRELYANEPRFENDREFLPLQAADLWAWWVRHWAETGQKENITKHDFGCFQRTRGKGKRLTLDISFSEDEFIPTLARMAQRQLPDREVIILPKQFG